MQETIAQCAKILYCTAVGTPLLPPPPHLSFHLGLQWRTFLHHKIFKKNLRNRQFKTMVAWDSLNRERTSRSSSKRRWRPFFIYIIFSYSCHRPAYTLSWDIQQTLTPMLPLPPPQDYFENVKIGHWQIPRQAYIIFSILTFFCLGEGGEGCTVKSPLRQWLNVHFFVQYIFKLLDYPDLYANCLQCMVIQI